MFELLPILLKFLPSVAGMIAGGKGEELGTIAAKVATDVLGTTDPVEVSAKLSDPNVLAAFQARLDAETAQLKLQVEDTQHARNIGLEYVREKTSIAWAPVIITSVVLFMVAGTIGLVAAKLLTDNSIVVGWVLGAGSTAIAYWLGSSSGSKRSGDAVREIAVQASSKR